jgi:hypothetical protein
VGTTAHAGAQRRTDLGTTSIFLMTRPSQS